MNFTCEFFEVSPEDIDRFEQAYPAVNIRGELLKMHCWLIANPLRRKKKYNRFINNWLAKCHGRLLEAQVSAQTREFIKLDQRRVEARVGKWDGYK